MPTYADYSLYQKLFSAYGLAFLLIKKNIVFFDGEKFDSLSKDQILYMFAHEIAHAKLKHVSKRSKRQEKEADQFAINLLTMLDYKRAVDLAQAEYLLRYDEEFFVSPETEEALQSYLAELNI